MSDNANILVLGTADWNQPIATNQHYAVREMCKLPASSVTFIESLALRRPQFNRRDFQRIYARIVRLLRKDGSRSDRNKRDIPEGAEVLSLLTLPWHSGLAPLFNRFIVSRATLPWWRSPSRRILWTYSPVTHGLERIASTTIYHCVDLLGELPGIDSRVIRFHESRLAARGTLAIASSSVVKRHLENVGFKKVLLWENVADVAMFTSARQLAEHRIPGRVIFAGNLTPSKVDFTLLRQLCKAGLEVRLAGPVAEGGAHDNGELERLKLAGAAYLGMLSLQELAEELSTCTVGLIPYVVNDYTKGVSPLKTYEYAAAGLPIVSTGIPGVTPSENLIWVENSTRDFISRVIGLSDTYSNARADLLVEHANDHSWSRRGQQIRDLILNSPDQAGRDQHEG